MAVLGSQESRNKQNRLNRLDEVFFLQRMRFMEQRGIELDLSEGVGSRKVNSMELVIGGSHCLALQTEASLWHRPRHRGYKSHSPHLIRSIIPALLVFFCFVLNQVDALLLHVVLLG